MTDGKAFTPKQLSTAQYVLALHHPLRANSFAGTKESIREIRHVYLDLDEDAPASLRAIRTDGSAPMEDLRRANSRSTFYSERGDLRELGLWPPSAGPFSLPALEMPQLENVLAVERALSSSSNTREANENAIMN